MRESEGETAGEKIPSGERGTKKNTAGWTRSVKVRFAKLTTAPVSVFPCRTSTITCCLSSFVFIFILPEEVCIRLVPLMREQIGPKDLLRLKLVRDTVHFNNSLWVHEILEACHLEITALKHQTAKTKWKCQKLMRNVGVFMRMLLSHARYRKDMVILA